jgi:hypothetical protein
MGHPTKLNERIKDLQAIELPGQTRESKSFCNIYAAKTSAKVWAVNTRSPHSNNVSASAAWIRCRTVSSRCPKQRILTRRLRLMATGQLYPVRPSFLMLSMTARTEAAVRNVLLPWAALWQNITIG